MCNNTQKKKAAGAGKDFTLFFGVMLHFNFKCVVYPGPIDPYFLAVILIPEPHFPQHFDP